MRMGKGPGIAATIVLLLAVGGGVGACGENTTGPAGNVASATPSAASPAPPVASSAPSVAPPARAPGAPVSTPAAPAPPASIPAAPAPTSASAASCHPLSNGGNCYEPGEFCRKGDHGVTGVAGDGETIMCEDNNGWRWEPA